MKKTAAIISLYGNSNYGNKLQNYAVQEILRREGIDSVNIINVPCLNNKNRDISAVLKFYLKGIVQSIIKGDRIKDCVDPNDPKQRKENFLRFNEQIVNSKHFFSFNRLSEFKDYDYYFVGSDQIWNPQYGGLSDLDLLTFTQKKKIAISASFGIEKLPSSCETKVKQCLSTFDAMGKCSGTDGFRGEAGIDLTADHAYKVGRFLGWYYNMLRERNGNNEPARIVIGKDTRRSSYMFEYSLDAGLTASGADAYLLHVTTTPSVAYIARVDDFDCGIMISASHNPYYDNGIKLIDCYGEKMPEETLLLVEDYIDGKLHVFDKDWPELPFAHREHIGCTVDYVAGRNRYMGYLISLGIYSFKGVKAGLDCANGASWNIAKSVFDALGADTYVINNKPNGLNINNNAGSTHIEGLQKFVVENGLDVGFAFDGDADRCLCVDEKGNVITGDHILYIYGCYMKKRGKLLTNTVVTTVMSNFGLYKAFDEQGIGYVKTAVGDKYVYEYMAKNGCRIGGEQSGHIIFSKYASTGDGILTSLKMMEVMLAKKMPMSKLAEPLKIYPQVLENVRVTDKKTAQNDPAVQEAVKAVAEALGDTGRILVRESGTEPVVRVMVEAPDHDTCQKYVSQVVEVIKSRGYAV